MTFGLADSCQTHSTPAAICPGLHDIAVTRPSGTCSARVTLLPCRAHNTWLLAVQQVASACDVAMPWHEPSASSATSPAMMPALLKQSLEDNVSRIGVAVDDRTNAGWEGCVLVRQAKPVRQRPPLSAATQGGSSSGPINQVCTRKHRFCLNGDHQARATVEPTGGHLHAPANAVQVVHPVSWVILQNLVSDLST